MNLFRKLSGIPDWKLRTAIVLISSILLLLIFLFQRLDYFLTICTWLGFDYSQFSNFFVFSFNKTLRFLLNDLLTIAIIYGIFYERKFVVVAFLVQLFGLLILLPSYLSIKFFSPGYNGPMINFLHRLTLNPLILLMLIPLFYIQRENVRKLQ